MKWKGWTDSANSWEPAEDIQNEELIKAFEENKENEKIGKLKIWTLNDHELTLALTLTNLSEKRSRKRTSKFDSVYDLTQDTDEDDAEMADDEGDVEMTDQEKQPEKILSVRRTENGELLISELFKQECYLQNFSHVS